MSNRHCSITWSVLASGKKIKTKIFQVSLVEGRVFKKCPDFEDKNWSKTDYFESGHKVNNDVQRVVFDI